MGMNHLTGEQFEELVRELERALRKLERSMGITAEALRPVSLDQTAVGRLSRIDTLQTQGLTRNLRDREQALWDGITGAFRRIREGTYGLCVECGGEIRFERLQVFPETLTCAPCASP
jgi:DnaK suppressor protein